MSEAELESTILAFLEGQYDVLVTTTIIETGVDIPNVNTLIVYDADRMGLSQLYQLRGRVGRSNRVAYAYFTYRKDKVLNETAEKRLQAIKEFTELGSGFKIAMRDLSIRGAGNILGAEQHGFIDSVGFDLYSQMLKEAIEKRRGLKQEEERPDVVIDVEVDAYIPDTYISDGLQKIEMYKRFKAVETLEARAVLEGLAARYAARNATDADIADLREIVGEMEARLAEGELPIDVRPRGEMDDTPCDRRRRKRVGRGPRVFTHELAGTPAPNGRPAPAHRPTRGRRLPEVLVLRDALEDPAHIEPRLPQLNLDHVSSRRQRHTGHPKSRLTWR